MFVCIFLLIRQQSLGIQTLHYEHSYINMFIQPPWMCRCVRPRTSVKSWMFYIAGSPAVMHQLQIELWLITGLSARSLRSETKEHRQTERRGEYTRRNKLNKSVNIGLKSTARSWHFLEKKESPRESIPFKYKGAERTEGGASHKNRLKWNRLRTGHSIRTTDKWCECHQRLS